MVVVCGCFAAYCILLTARRERRGEERKKGRGGEEDSGEETEWGRGEGQGREGRRRGGGKRDFFS